MFYYFSQNNSGGGFDSIGYGVIIEADSANHANERAEEIGIYFDGCETDRDCPCCGNRWYRVDSSDGTERPSVYGQFHTGCGDDVTNYNLPTPIFYLDGRKENYRKGPTKLEKALK